jgi:hypothetical protein
MCMSMSMCMHTRDCRRSRLVVHILDGVCCREYVWAYGRVGVWACRRVGAWACGRYVAILRRLDGRGHRQMRALMGAVGGLQAKQCAPASDPSLGKH